MIVKKLETKTKYNVCNFVLQVQSLIPVSSFFTLYFAVFGLTETLIRGKGKCRNILEVDYF